MRDKFISELFKELLGPSKGCEEILDKNKNPIKEYVTGIIVPRGYKSGIDPDSEPTLEVEEDEEGSFSESSIISGTINTDLDPKSRPKSFGLSFLLMNTRPEFSVCVTWGRYKLGDKGWVRTPHLKIDTIVMPDNKLNIKRLLYDGNDGKIELEIRKIKDINNQGNVIAVHLVNNLSINEQPDNNELAEASVFQPQIRINTEGTKLASLSPEGGEDKQVMSFLYRNKPTLARGYMCSAIWKNIDYQKYIDSSKIWPDIHHFKDCKEFINPDIRSEFLPMCPVPSPVFEPDSKYGNLPEFNTSKLCELWEKEDIDNYLLPIISAYEMWIKENHQSIDRENFGKNRELAEKLIRNQEETLKRIKDGVNILKNDDDARLAFCFANKTMHLQSKWRNKNQKIESDLKWRPFQLAFLLMNIEPAYNKDSEYRNVADLLWIPTGGGKTEAYLAIMAFVIALRRLKSQKSEAADGSGSGVSIITRYTLRLLTVQQFRRTLNMITAAEYLRVMKTNKGHGWRPKKYGLNKDYIYGSARFSIGMWVGSGVTPNKIKEAIKALQDGMSQEGEPAQVIRCPACKSWLSVPNEGIPQGEHYFYILANLANSGGIESASEKIKSVISKYTHIKDIEIIQDKSGFVTVSMHTINLSRNISRSDIDSLWKKITEECGLNLIPLSASRPGYFGYKKGLRKNSSLDFEIYCPNPDCELNRDIDYSEGIHYGGSDASSEKFEDGLIKRHVELPFYGTRIPITAYTIDEQIYHRCPTVIISTADKIARMAFEPETAMLFGNVDGYNAYSGYYRDSTHEKNRYDRVISGLKPPDMIIQDELHLLEGPLGSLFGLYETVVEGLIKLNGGKPKYIASTATIENADFQVMQLFGKRLCHFPSHGLQIDSNFFVNIPSFEESWNEIRPGRIYMGICTPGVGSQTALVRIWARLLKTREDLKDDQNLKYFWTTIGYFNSVRELGNANALYRHDIIEWFRNIAGRSAEISNMGNEKELSGRINSTDIPQILDTFEAEGEKDRKDDIEKNTDAVFTTSMFGTGVDISHFSLMIVDGQPKMNSQYIQATGRVGRAHGGLVITYLKASQPRDLSHYELFPSYHGRLYLEVEPVSVSPFSAGTLSRAAGPVLVSFLRSMKNHSVPWPKGDGSVILDPQSANDIEKFIQDVLMPRIDYCGYKNQEELKNYFISQRDRWQSIARDVGSGQLDFFEYNEYGEPKKNVVLGDPVHKHKKLRIVYENALQSLRDIEETTSFQVTDND